MISYPQLSPSQQHNLPELQQVTAVPAMFEDSTHQLWQCETDYGPMMLKVCASDNVTTSSFWQGMQQLFAVDFPKQLGGFSQVYQKVAEISPLAIPGYIASSSALNKQSSPAFILARIVSGKMIDAMEVDNAMVRKLAEHISQLHQYQQTTWGELSSAYLMAQQWPQRLQDTLNHLAKTRQIPDNILAEAISQAENISVEKFVPIMPDLRWDQFLQQNGSLSALVDLDAFVYGPRELELVLLEYLLDEQQAILFAEHYQKKHSLPELTQVRKPYRLLLFMMNVLGEKDVNVWMKASIRF